MLDIDKLKHKGMTKKEYFVAIDQAVENITLFHRLIKELYRIDCEVENELR